MSEQCTTSYERKHLLRLLCEGRYSEEYNKRYQTFIILTDVGDDIAPGTTPRECIDILVSRGLFDEAYAFAKAHQVESHQITLRSIQVSNPVLSYHPMHRTCEGHSRTLHQLVPNEHQTSTEPAPNQYQRVPNQHRTSTN